MRNDLCHHLPSSATAYVSSAQLCSQMHHGDGVCGHDEWRTLTYAAYGNRDLNIRPVLPLRTTRCVLDARQQMSRWRFL